MWVWGGGCCRCLCPAMNESIDSSIGGGAFSKGIAGAPRRTSLEKP